MKLSLFFLTSLFLLASCSSVDKSRPDKETALKTTEETPPANPGLLEVNTSFAKGDLGFIADHGDSNCQKIAEVYNKPDLAATIDPAKVEKVLRLTRKLCTEDNKWKGYGEADGIKNSDINQRFFANYVSLQDLIWRAMKTNKEGADGGSTFLYFNSSLSQFERDRTLFVPSYNKVLAEYDRGSSLTTFQQWVRSLNDWYATH